jgi:N-acetylglucosaminyldiphosphoundecaprenol N-acetyl-beta-D-mannosaminyltransferase
MGRMRGPDLTTSVCAVAAERGWSSFFYGGAPGTPELLSRKLRERFPGLRVAGCHSPPFRPLTPEEDERIVAKINGSGADLVWVGLSTPKQEKWMADHLGRLTAPVLLGVGAAFDVHAGLKHQAPSWLRPSGLEWVWRALQDPRLWRRYVRNNPVFLARIARQRPYLRAEENGGVPRG